MRFQKADPVVRMRHLPSVNKTLLPLCECELGVIRSSHITDREHLRTLRSWFLVLILGYRVVQ